MSWNEARSIERIRQHQKTVPEFDAAVTLAADKAMRAEARKGLMDTLPVRRAFVVEAAQLYGQLLDFDAVVSENDQETEQSHTRLLEFLDLYYQLWDEIIDANSADRVDYHVARMHAVVTDPAGDPIGQVERAYALAVALSGAARRIGAASGFSGRVRFGIRPGSLLGDDHRPRSRQRHLVFRFASKPRSKKSRKN